MPPPSMLSTVTIFALVGAATGEGDGAVMPKHRCVVKSSSNEMRKKLVIFCIASVFELELQIKMQ